MNLGPETLHGVIEKVIHAFVHFIIRKPLTQFSSLTDYPGNREHGHEYRQANDNSQSKYEESNKKIWETVGLISLSKSSGLRTH